ncbi:MAG: hypothetical protein ACRC9X_08620 [Bacteroidales bacterium]
MKYIWLFFLHTLRAKNRGGHGIHSPFAYDLVQKVFIAARLQTETTKKQERYIQRLQDFCLAQNILITEPQTFFEQKTVQTSLCIVPNPYQNRKLWDAICMQKNVTVSILSCHIGVAIASSHLYKQKYTI